MTKSELIKALEDWPENAKIEMSIPIDIDDPKCHDKIWFEIAEIETVIDNVEPNNHCLLYAGRVTME